MPISQSPLGRWNPPPAPNRPRVGRMVQEMVVTNLSPLNIDGQLYSNGTRLETSWLVDQLGLPTLETLMRIGCLWPADKAVQRPNAHDQDHPIWVAPEGATPVTSWLTMEDYATFNS